MAFELWRLGFVTNGNATLNLVIFGMLLNILDPRNFDLS